VDVALLHPAKPRIADTKWDRDGVERYMRAGQPRTAAPASRDRNRTEVRGRTEVRAVPPKQIKPEIRMQMLDGSLVRQARHRRRSLQLQRGGRAPSALPASAIVLGPGGNDRKAGPTRSR